MLSGLGEKAPLFFKKQHILYIYHNLEKTSFMLPVYFLKLTN